MKSVLVAAATAAAAAVGSTASSSYTLSRTPASAVSQPIGPQFVSYSFEPAYWTEFFGVPGAPNTLTFSLLNLLHDRGARSIIRPGGITMDSMVYDANQKKPVVRTENGKGGVLKVTVGPAFYQQWNDFPAGTRFVSTLNFGSNSLATASGLAVGSAHWQRDKIAYFELGNEPTNYASSRWHGSTKEYITQWQSFTASIDAALPKANTSHGYWWASSATTDVTSLHVRPSDLIPAGVNSTGEVAQYSIHSYAFATCDPGRTAKATIPAILNHTGLKSYADTEIYPSAQAAMKVGAQWVIGEFNSIACSGKPNVSDTFAQALWTADVSLLYGLRNASALHLHQGAALVFQSDQQLNTPGDDGTPGYSSYDLLYPIDSTKRGKARVLPVFVSQLLIVEATAGGGRIAALPTPSGLKESEFAAYAVYQGDGKTLARMVILNMKPYVAGQKAAPSTLSLDIGSHKGASVKRMTAPMVDEKDAAKVTWAGQSFRDGVAVGNLVVERLAANDPVAVRDSEAVLVTFDQ